MRTTSIPVNQWTDLETGWVLGSTGRSGQLPRSWSSARSVWGGQRFGADSGLGGGYSAMENTDCRYLETTCLGSLLTARGDEDI